jgi:hypothetical protein
MYIITLETLFNEKYYVKFVIYVTNLSKLMDIRPKTDFMILLDTTSYRFITNGIGFAAINYMG